MAVSLKDRYVASMVLSGVGDAVGYKNGDWEFCKDGERIHKELQELGGIEKIHVSLPGWRVSDDTVLHLATAEGLIEFGEETDLERLYLMVARRYKHDMNTDMENRGPGSTTMGGCSRLKPDEEKGYCIPFNPRGLGCGAAMRAMCIGLRYPYPEDLDTLIAVSIECGRITHHHPTAYLGSLTSALFISYSIQGRPLPSWGQGLMETLPKALEYIKSTDRYVKQNVEAWDFFRDKWTEYLKERNILEGQNDPVFPDKYGVKERDAFYDTLSLKHWGGSCGHDAPMIAYDALMGAKDSWKELCNRAMFHYGDSDSTGVIAGACFGAMYGYEGVPACNHKSLEYRDRLAKAGEILYSLRHKTSEKK